MPDWNHLVKTRLEQTSLHPFFDAEVIAEIAGHLEETFNASRSLGLSESEALEVTLQEVQDWRALARKIHRTKSEEDLMNHRTRSLWIPAMASLLGASLAMALLQWAGVQPRMVWTSPVAMCFYWSWLGVLPAFGGLGAYLSRRAGGSIRFRLTAAMAPVLWLLVMGFMIEPIELAFNGVGHLRIFGYAVGNWVGIPGLALLLGALPFLYGSKQGAQAIC